MQIKKEIKLFAKTKNLQNFIVPLLFILTFLLVLFNKTDYLLVNKLKSTSLDIFSKVSIVISYPIQISTKSLNFINELKFIRLENERLKEEVIRLKKWQTLALKNTRENKAFKKLLNSTSNNLNIVKTAAVISQSPSIYSKLIIINAGLNHQIENNLTVVNERGLVGRVISVTNKQSRVQLIIDQNSAIPVKLINKKFYAIFNGSSNGRLLISTFIKDNTKPIVGDILVTSGNGGLYPSNILVGKIVSVTDTEVIALPFVDFKNIEYLQVIKNN